VYITTIQPDTKSNPKPNANHNPITKQQAKVNIQLNIVTCPTYPDKCCCTVCKLTTLGCNCYTASSLSVIITDRPSYTVVDCRTTELFRSPLPLVSGTTYHVMSHPHRPREFAAVVFSRSFPDFP